MKDFKITEAMSMEDQENIIKNIKMVLDQLPAAKAQMKAFGASEQEIKNFQAPILKFLDDAKREMESTEGDEAIAAARKELGGMFETKNKKMENLNEGKKNKSNYMTELAEIDRQSALVALEAKINKLAEMAEAKTNRLNMVNEDENLSELISKQAVKEMQRSIKEIERLKEKLLKEFTKKGGKMTEVIDEEMRDEKVDEEMRDEKVEERNISTSYEEDGSERNMEEEMKEKEETNEEVSRWQKLAGI